MARQELKELGLEGVFNPEGIEARSGMTRARGQAGFVAGVRMETGARPQEDGK